MRRPEEGIGAWLAAGRRNSGSERRRFKLSPWTVRALAHTRTLEAPLTMCAGVKGNEVGLDPGRIVDGLGTLCEQNAASDLDFQPARKDEGVGTIELMGPAVVGGCLPALGGAAAVQSLALVRVPRLHSFQHAFSRERLRVHCGGLISDHVRVHCDSRWFVKTSRYVCNGTPWFSRLPQRRTGMEVDRLGRQEFEGLLREAERIKGIAPGAGELIAVFRNVPVEMIDRLRIVDSGKGLVYTVRTSSRQQRTRIRDIAAVLDRSTIAMHLIPHRTRYRTIILM